MSGTDDGPRESEGSRTPPTTDVGAEIGRRRLVKIVIVVAVVVPVLIEAVTFAGLVSHSLGDAGDGAATTAEPEGVGVGDDLLAETPEPETVRAASVRARDGSWLFRFTVSVTNTGERPYEVRLTAVTTTGGRTVPGATATGVLAPGQRGNVTGAWSLPEGQRPETVDVTVARGSGTDRTTTGYTVRLAPVPVSR